MMHLIFDFLPISISIKYFEDVFDFLICLHPEMRICYRFICQLEAKGTANTALFRSPISHHVKELVQLDGSILILKL